MELNDVIVNQPVVIDNVNTVHFLSKTITEFLDGTPAFL